MIPDILAWMIDGFVSAKTLYPSPRSSSFPGIKLSTLYILASASTEGSGGTYTTSTSLTRSRMMLRPASCFRLTAMERLLRLIPLKYSDVFLVPGFQSLSSPSSRHNRVSSCNIQVSEYSGLDQGTHSSFGVLDFDHVGAVVC